MSQSDTYEDALIKALLSLEEYIHLTPADDGFEHSDDELCLCGPTLSLEPATLIGLTEGSVMFCKHHQLMGEALS